MALATPPLRTGAKLHIPQRAPLFLTCIKARRHRLRACADVWNQLRERRLAMASIGALFDELDEQLLDELYGSNISFSKL